MSVVGAIDIDGGARVILYSASMDVTDEDSVLWLLRIILVWKAAAELFRVTLDEGIQLIIFILQASCCIEFHFNAACIGVVTREDNGFRSQLGHQPKIDVHEFLCGSLEVAADRASAEDAEG